MYLNILVARSYKIGLVQQLGQRKKKEKKAWPIVFLGEFRAGKEARVNRGVWEERWGVNWKWLDVNKIIR